MKLSDVVKQVQSVLPKYTALFSPVMGISNISAVGGVATIQSTLNHNLRPNQAVTLNSVQNQTGINSVSKDGNLVTFGTAVPHDLTEGWVDHETVELSGFTDGVWNDTFTLLSVPNRNTFVVQTTNLLPVLNGNEVLLEVRSDGINGRYETTVTGDKSFTMAGNFIDGEYSGGSFSSGVRVAGSIDFESAIAKYTKQLVEDAWMFVVMHDAELSKDRKTFSDATATRGTGDDLRTRLIDGFSLLILINTSEQITAVDAMDTARHTLLLPILKTIYGARFDTGLSGGADFKAVLTGHGIFSYNRAYMAYIYDFEFVSDITNDDAVEPTDTRAFRDIDFIERIGGDDTEEMTVTVNLDDEE